ncbi:MAG: acyl carrier protein [Ruminococcaceae bacterium]|nr:acyl carrier protein [Oscillospiraceae bacterium]
MAMSRNEIIKKLAEVMALTMPDTAIDLANLREDMTLVGDLGLTSVGILYNVIAIEEFFNIRFDNIGFADLKTVGEVVSYIEKKSGE